MNKGKTYLAVIGLVTGIAILVLVIFVLVFSIMSARGFTMKDGARYMSTVRWDYVAIYLTPLAIIGILLILLGVNYFRNKTVLR